MYFARDLNAVLSLRQDFLANELNLQFDRLSNQARFVKMIVQKQLSVSGRKKADIVHELREKQFRPFPKIAKAKAAGETQEAIEDEEEEVTGADSDYDYLLGMAIWSLTKEKVRLLRLRCTFADLLSKIEKLEAQAAEKEEELMILLKKTPAELWNTDLDKFLEEWQVHPLSSFLWSSLIDLSAKLRRMGNQGCCGLKRQEAQEEANHAQDSQVPHWWQEGQTPRFRRRGRL
jgi:hypothetical protein